MKSSEYRLLVEIAFLCSISLIAPLLEDSFVLHRENQINLGVPCTGPREGLIASANWAQVSLQWQLI